MDFSSSVTDISLLSSVSAILLSVISESSSEIKTSLVTSNTATPSSYLLL